MQRMLQVIEKDGRKWTKKRLLQRNPDVIITTYGFMWMNQLTSVNSEGWEDIRRLKTNRVIDVNSDIVTRPGPRLVEGVEELAKAIYPDSFSNNKRFLYHRIRFFINLDDSRYFIGSVSVPMTDIITNYW